MEPKVETPRRRNLPREVKERDVLPEHPQVSSGRKASGLWGRRDSVKLLHGISTSVVMFCSPLLLLYLLIVVRTYKGELHAPVWDLFVYRTATFQSLLKSSGVYLSSKAALIYVGWLVYQAVLAVFLPGPRGYGQPTPAGHVLEYKVNGLNVWFVTHLLFIFCSYVWGLFPATIIYDNFGSLFLLTNAYGILLSSFSYLKACYFPTHPNDVKFTGSFFYDFFMGAELNPRIGSFDFKLFHNGRIGIVAWTLINFSFAAKQYERIGYVTNSMILVNILQALYVVDFFYNEDWYLRTIDIAHDHFGFYLAWGDATWLPYLYTLQAAYLAENVVDLSPLFAGFVFILGLSGYVVFRLANNQKNVFRASNGKCAFWGKPAEFIVARYHTVDGLRRQSLLLTSGCWGLARHVNYLGDLMLSLAFCLACGFVHPLPHFYFFYMSLLLLNRRLRDDRRCHGKYGEDWVEYCKRVPYKIIPKVY